MKKSNFNGPIFPIIVSVILLGITISVINSKKISIKENPTVENTLSSTPLPTTTNPIYPSQILNLTNWKLTLPTGPSNSPTEIEQPKLSDFRVDPWFVIAPGNGAVIFRAPVNGSSTSGSDYPRSELREMADAKTKANWSSEKGVHTMFLEQAITAVPNTKRDVVAGQIHDEDKDIIVIRLDYPTLHIRVDGENVHTLDSNYTLGKKFSIKFEIKDNKTLVYYNGSTLSVFTLDKKYSDAYFKAGVYTQSNCEKEKAKSLCNTDNYGEVFLYKLEVTHK